MAKIRSEKEKVSSISSGKLLLILECLAETNTPLQLQEIAKKVDIPQATVLRYLHTLQEQNYVFQHESSARYELTWRVCKLGKNLNNKSSLRFIASPFVNKLASDFNMGSCLVIEENFSCVYLDCIDNGADFGGTLQRIGKGSPLHSTGSGKVLLASFSESQLDEFFSSHLLERLTDNTIIDPQKLRAELALVRDRGYAIDDRECEANLRCISCPLRNFNGAVIAAISVFGDPRILSTEYMIEKVLPEVQKSAILISKRLGYIAE